MPNKLPKGTFVRLYDDRNFDDRELTLSDGENVKNMKAERSDPVDGKKGKYGFGDKTSSVKWRIPDGRAVILYRDRDYRGPLHMLLGTGEVEEIDDFDDYDFGDETSSAKWVESASLFTFSKKLKEHEEMLRNAHQRAYLTIKGCNRLTKNQEKKLRKKYFTKIAHDVTNDPDVFGSATIGGERIWLNPDTLFGFGEDEIVRTLIHEMMHCAGYEHPKKKSTDVPGDNGPYYGSPPLLAEVCATGIQTFALGTAEAHLCEPSGTGLYVIRKG